MKKAILLWILSLFAMTMVGQKARISVFGGGGAWIGSLGYNDVYAGDYQKWQLNIGGGGEAELHLNPRPTLIRLEVVFLILSPRE
jgi:hypothetical protein